MPRRYGSVEVGRWCDMERREHPRMPTALPASFSGNGLAGGGLIAGLSAKGCTLINDELMLPGSTVALHIQLPEQYAPLKVDLAEVRWAQGRECGLEFVRLRLEEKQRLRQFIGRLQRPPRGGPRQIG